MQNNRKYIQFTNEYYKGENLCSLSFKGSTNIRHKGKYLKRED